MVLGCTRLGGFHRGCKPKLDAAHLLAYLLVIAEAFIPKILKQGFNRSFAGRHGTLLGHATYFSSDPRYSLRFCDKKGGQDGTKVGSSKSDVLPMGIIPILCSYLMCFQALPVWNQHIILGIKSWWIPHGGNVVFTSLDTRYRDPYGYMTWCIPSSRCW